MDIRIFKNEAEIGEAVGKLYCDFINSKPDCVLGFATGATPVPTYNYIVEQYKAGKVSFKDVKTFNLDEYCDLPKTHKNSYYTFMLENLFSKVDVNLDNVASLTEMRQTPRRRAQDTPQTLLQRAASIFSFSASAETVILLSTSRRMNFRARATR